MKRFGFVFLAGVIAASTVFALTAETAWDRGMIFKPLLSIKGIFIGPDTGTYTPTKSVLNKMTRSYGASATIDFASTSTGVVLSSSVPTVGARAGDPCFVGVPTAAAALKAEFGCYVDAADSVKVWFAPRDTAFGSVALSSASPSTATVSVSASSVCMCSPLGASAAVAAAGCATGVSSTTLTLTGPNTVTTTMGYSCAAPVDPASGTYYVRVISSIAN